MPTSLRSFVIDRAADAVAVLGMTGETFPVDLRVRSLRTISKGRDRSALDQ